FPDRGHPRRPLIATGQYEPVKWPRPAVVVPVGLIRREPRTQSAAFLSRLLRARLFLRQTVPLRAGHCGGLRLQPKEDSLYQAGVLSHRLMFVLDGGKRAGRKEVRDQGAVAAGRMRVALISSRVGQRGMAGSLARQR